MERRPELVEGVAEGALLDDEARDEITEINRAVTPRLAGARHILQGHDEDEPHLALPFVCEALTYLIAHTDDSEMRVHLLEDLGWLLPDAKFRERLTTVEPATRTYLLGHRALQDTSLDEALDAVMSLAPMPAASRLTSKLLSRVLDELYDRRLPPRGR